MGPRSLRDLVDDYRPDTPLELASTIPASWYVDPRLLALERYAIDVGIELLRREGDVEISVLK